MFSLNFILSVGTEEEEKESDWFLLLCSWRESGFVCLLLGRIGGEVVFGVDREKRGGNV